MALWQARHVASLLAKNDVKTELVPLTSQGDTDMRPIDGTRQVGLFTKRIQQALLDDEADVAVHSLKDLPTEVHPELTLAAVPERETVADCLVSSSGGGIFDFPEGAKIGTGSTRRRAQLASLRPDLQILPIRGNVQTRLGKLESGDFDAIVLAQAGLLRLELNDLPRHEFEIDRMLPAPGQGALGIEVRQDDSVASNLIHQLDDLSARLAVTAERSALAALHGGCLAPVAAYATVGRNKASVRLRVRVLNADGSRSVEIVESQGLPLNDRVQGAVALGEQVAARLHAAGASELIESVRAHS